MSEQIESQSFQRIPPHDQSAEQAVLSSMIFDGDGIMLAADVLRGDDFYRPDHKIIFDSIMELYTASVPVDLITLKSKLEEKGVFDRIGMEYIAEIANVVSTSTRVKHYAKIVEEKSILRKLIRMSGEVSDLSYQGQEHVDNIIEVAEKNIFNIIQNRNADDFSPIREILVNSIDKIEQIYYAKSKITGIETGFSDFDSKMAGLQKSDFILIAARPSMGKTAFALNIAGYAALHKKVPTAIFSLEMSKEQLVNRLLCSEALVDSQRVRTGQLEQSDWEKIARTIGDLSEAPVYIDDTPGITSMEIRSKCRKLKLEKGLGLIVIDYLQLMSGSGRSDSRQQEISEISRALKALAREMDAPVIALSQLSRACETRADHRPMLSDLRESGAIEQDADVVTFLYRDEYYHPDTEKKNQAEVIIAKQRNGPTGTVDLIWLGNYTKFANMEKDASYNG